MTFQHRFRKTNISQKNIGEKDQSKKKLEKGRKNCVALAFGRVTRANAGGALVVAVAVVVIVVVFVVTFKSTQQGVLFVLLNR